MTYVVVDSKIKITYVKGAFQMPEMNDLDKMLIMKELARLAKMLEDNSVTPQQYLIEKEKLMTMLTKHNPKA